MRKHASRLLVLSIPTIIEEILSTLLQYVDTAMVGRLGEEATAAVSTTTTITWLVNSVPGAIGTAMLILISRASGAGDQKQVEIVLGGLSVVLSPYIPGWMGADPGIRAEASRYFFIVSIPMVFRTASSVLGDALRAVQDTKTPMLISVAANILNIILNYILIYPMGLGVAGAAISSAVSYMMSGILMYLVYRRKQELHWKWNTFSAEAELLKECTAVGSPVLGTSVVSCLGYVVFASLVSGMGTTVFAAHSIAVTAETIFYVPGYGLRTATSALIGTARGEKDDEKIAAVGKLSVLLTLGIMCVSGVILYIGAYPLMSLFTPSTAVVELGGEMLRIVALSEPFFGLMIVLEGIFYGLGRTGVETFGMWGVRIFSTFLCVRVWGLGLRAVWYCMIADNICKAVLFALPFLVMWVRSKKLYKR